MDAAAVLPTPGRVLWGRAVVLGGAAFAAGALSHVAGGGWLPRPVVSALLLVGTVLAASRFLRGRATAVRLVLLVVAGQTVLHGLLSVLAGHRGDTAPVAGLPAAPAPVLPAEPGPRTGSLFDHYQRIYADPVSASAGTGGPGDWLGHQVDHLVAQGPAMVLAHLAGAVALGLFLAVGESSLWALLALLAARAHVVRVRWGLVLQAVHVRIGTRLVRLRVRAARGAVAGPQVAVADGVSRRGPPRLLAA